TICRSSSRHVIEGCCACVLDRCSCYVHNSAADENPDTPELTSRSASRRARVGFGGCRHPSSVVAWANARETERNPQARARRVCPPYALPSQSPRGRRGQNTGFARAVVQLLERFGRTNPIPR